MTIIQPRFRAALLLPALCAWPLAGMALDGESARPSIRAAALDTPPVIDGRIDGDPAWSGVPAAGGFTQITPDRGEPASQRTELRVAFDDRNLYIAIRCYDDDPGSIVVSDSRRDASLEESDSLTLILDTFRDGQNGFVFGTNPSGLEYDGQLVREGSNGFGFTGGDSGFNRNWDGVWQVETGLDDQGWSAEFAIPFATLRYPQRADQEWGLNVQRNIRRRNEQSFWAPLDLQYSLYRVIDAGTLSGLEPPPQRTLQIVPYATASFSRLGDSTDNDQDGGLDLKYGITPSLTLDLTWNTDFAQVEVDEVQVNLDRFNLFFPEKRPFFLENAGQFSVGQQNNIELFFSRRIGIGDEGQVIPIEGGARLSGKLERTNVGLLHMRTESRGDTAANAFSVARLSQEFDNRSSLGAMFVQREARGPLAAPDDEHRTLGFDGRWGIGEHGQVSGFIAQTETPGLDYEDQAWSIQGAYGTEAWEFSLSWTEVEENFNPEVGFLRRNDAYRSPSISLLRRVRPVDSPSGIHELRPHITYVSYESFDGFKQSARVHVDNHWEWKSGAEIHLAVNFRHEGLLEPFEIWPGIVVPTGAYDTRELQFIAFTNRGAPLSYLFQTVAGGFFNGDRVFTDHSVLWRHGERFTSEWGWTRNEIDLPNGEFTTNLGRIRLSYSLSPRSTLQALMQYNGVDEVWSTNLRYSWLRTANTGLFVVYNDARGFGGYGGEQPNRAILVKYSHLFHAF